MLKKLTILCLLLSFITSAMVVTTEPVLAQHPTATNQPIKPNPGKGKVKKPKPKPGPREEGEDN